MLPGGVLSSYPVTASIPGLAHKNSVPLVDYALGGKGIGDSSDGVQSHQWTISVVGDDVKLSSDIVAPFVLFTRPNIKEVALAFDQSMTPYVAFTQNDGTGWLRWYDTSVSATVFTQIPGATYLRLALDDVRQEYLSTSDVVLAYISGTSLCVRYQRERFGTEHVLATNVSARLVSIGMNSGNRFQFKLVPLGI